MSVPAGGLWHLRSRATSRGFPVLFRCTECTAQSVLQDNRAAFRYFVPTMKKIHVHCTVADGGGDAGIKSSQLSITMPADKAPATRSLWNLSQAGSRFQDVIKQPSWSRRAVPLQQTRDL